MFSGNDIVSMIDDILSDTQKCSIQSTYRKSLENYSDLFNSAKPKEKHRFLLPIRSSGIRHGIDIKRTLFFEKN